MPWSVTFRPDAQILVTTYEGHMPPPEVVEAIEASYDGARRHGTTRAIADCSRLQSLPGFSNLLTVVAHSQTANPLKRLAVVLPVEQTVVEAIRVWAAAAQATGIETSVVTTLSAAEAWLGAPETPAVAAAHPSDDEPWHVEFQETLGCVELAFRGYVTLDHLIVANRTALALAAAHGTVRVLADCSALLGGHSVFDLYEVARNLEQFGATALVQEAVVVPAAPGAAEVVRFWVTAAANRGMRVQAFDDRPSAEAWLTA
jgi:hypothetical protein